MIALITIPVTPIFVENFEVGSFTVFFKEFPDILTEGDTEEKALFNLRRAIYDVYSLKNELP